MNIFILSFNPKRCAKMHANVHVVKMILEYAQMMCTAHHLWCDHLCAKPLLSLYKPTHKNHPCTKWVMESSSNYKWVYQLFIHLCDEYTYRYGKIHKTDSRLRELLRELPRGIPEGPKTPFILAMPNEYKMKCPKKSYRLFYSLDKLYNRGGKPMLYYTNRRAPEWLWLPYKAKG